MSKRRTGWRYVIMLAVMALVVGACGSTTKIAAKNVAGPVAQAAKAGNSKAAAIAAADAAVAEYSTLPSSLDLPAVGKRIPTGKHVFYISCAFAFCANVNVGLEAATKVLHWTDTVVTPQYSSQATITAWNQALAAHPNVIVVAPSFPLSIVQSQLTQAKQEGIIVLAQSSSGYPVGGSSPLVADNQGPVDQIKAGQLMADIAIKDAGGPPKVTLVIDPTIPLDQTVSAAFKKTVMAAGAQFNQLNISDANVGRTVPAQIVAYLQSHPTVQYLAMFNDYAETGVPQALQAAGLHVKLISGVSDLPDIPLVKNGTWTAAMFEQQYEAGWRLVDMAVRKTVGDDMSCCTKPAGPFLILTKRNISLGTANIRAFPYANKQFLKAWGK